MKDAIAEAWDQLRADHPAGVDGGIAGLLTIHRALEPAWLMNRGVAPERVGNRLAQIRAQRQRERSESIARRAAEEQRTTERAARAAAEERTIQQQAMADAEESERLMKSFDLSQLSTVDLSFHAFDQEAWTQSIRRSLDQIELSDDPLDFSRLCREIGRGISQLSPLLALFYLRQAICSNEDFLVPHDDAPAIEYADLELWYACVVKILRVASDYEILQLRDALGIGDSIEEINDIFVQASEAMVPFIWSLDDAATIDRLRIVCAHLADSARSVDDYVKEFNAEPIRSVVQREERDPEARLSPEQLRRGWRVIASRDLAGATLDLLSGRPAEVLQRIGQENLDEFQERLLSLGLWHSRDDQLVDAGELDELTFLRLLTVRAEARLALGLEPIDEKTRGLVGYWSTGFFSNWLDHSHRGAWVVEDSEDWLLNLEEWMGPQSPPYDGGSVGRALTLDLLVRLATLTKGTLRAAAFDPGYAFADRPNPRTVPELSALRLIAEMKPLLEQLRPTSDRLGHVLDVILDVRADQRVVTEILTAAGEKRISAAERLMRVAVPHWISLEEESRRELVAADLEYRAYLAGDREPEHAAGIALLFYRPVEREYRRWKRLREQKRMRASDPPPGWKPFEDERGFAAHADAFGEIDLTRMRSYLFGMYRRKEGMLESIAREIAESAPS